MCVVTYVCPRQRAEQDNEQRKKKEMAAEEQATPSPKKTDITPSPQKVRLASPAFPLFLFTGLTGLKCRACCADMALPFGQGPMMPKMPQMDLIAELKKRQVKPQVTDGAIEDIITGNVELQEHFE